MTDLPATHEELLARIPVPDGAKLEGSSITYGHDGIELNGYVAHDAAAQEPRPGILIVPDWLGVGPNAELRAQMLARLGYVAFVADVYDTIDGRTVDGLPTFADGLRAARITAAVLESAAHGHWVEVPR